MKALIVKGKDNLTIRLQDGLKAAGIASHLVTKESDFTSMHYDLAFIDPSVSYIIPNIDSDTLLFYDSEDDPKQFDKGPAYDQFKDKVKAYAKMNYLDNDRNDNIKNIGFPLSIYPTLRQIANHNAPDFSYKNAVPYLIGTPTFIGIYYPVENGIYNSEKDLNCIGTFDEGNLMYNQRIDWLLSLRKNNIPYQGGIVFHPTSNLSISWQSKYFGSRVSELQCQPVSYNDHINNLFNYRVALCPTGHDRLSWRTYDIMATGSILIRTEHKKQLALINPKEYITIMDGEDLGTKLLSIQKDYKEIWAAHQANRTILKTLTPAEITRLFLAQLE